MSTKVLPVPVATSSPRRSVEVCSAWRARQVPCTSDEEQEFLADLARLGAERGRASGGHAAPRPSTRRDVTVLITALRAGLTAADMLAQAPGVRPHDVLAAAASLERRRARGAEAWWRLVEDGTPHGLVVAGDRAATVMPALVTRLRAESCDPVRYRAVVHDLAAQVERTGRRVSLLEERIMDLGTTADADRRRELATLLFDVEGRGAWSLPTYLPTRLTTLVPLRIAALLGEDLNGLRRAG